MIDRFGLTIVVSLCAWGIGGASAIAQESSPPGVVVDVNEAIYHYLRSDRDGYERVASGSASVSRRTLADLLNAVAAPVERQDKSLLQGAVLARPTQFRWPLKVEHGPPSTRLQALLALNSFQNSRYPIDRRPNTDLVIDSLARNESANAPPPADS